MQCQPNNWSCIPTAFAMILDMDVQDLIKRIGHDGSEIIQPELPEPKCRRGFHPQEITIHYPRFVSYEFRPFLEEGYFRYDINHENEILELMYEYNGVLFGHIKNRNHCVAWYYNKIYDPNGTIYKLEEFEPEIFYLIT